MLELRVALILLAGIIATITDLKKGLIYDWLTLPLIAIGTILNFFEFNPMNFMIPAIVFVAFGVLYYLGKVGGGDVKLFVALAMLLPFYNNQPFLLPVLFFSALFSVMFLSVYYSLKYIKSGVDINKNRKSIIHACLFGVVIVAYFSLLTGMNLITLQAAYFIFLPLFFALPFLALQPGIKERFFLKYVSIDSLEEDEIIAKEFFKEPQYSHLFKIRGIITEKAKEQLKKAGIKEVPVYRQLPPFAPFILLGLIIALLYPDFLGLLFVRPN